MWVDCNPYFDAAMALLNIVHTEDKNEDYQVLPYAVVAFVLAFFVRRNPTAHTFCRIDLDTIHHAIFT